MVELKKMEFIKEGKVYTLRIRTKKQELAEFFSEKLYAHTSKRTLGVGGKLRIIPKNIFKNFILLHQL